MRRPPPSQGLPPCRFMWTLSPVFFPEYLSVEGSLQLRVNLSAIIFGQAIMKALFWVEAGAGPVICHPFLEPLWELSGMKQQTYKHNRHTGTQHIFFFTSRWVE